MAWVSVQYRRRVWTEPWMLIIEYYRYCEWEDYPEKKAKAHQILVSTHFPPPPEFQLGPVPDTNPVLEGMMTS